MIRPTVLLFCAILLAAPAAAEELVVQVTGAAGSTGKIVVSLWNAPKGFASFDRSKALTSRSAAVASGGAVVRFEELVPGRYAVAAFHDADGDGKLKTNFIGIPRESVGTSGKAGGMPSFEKSAIAVPGGPVSIALRSLGGS